MCSPRKAALARLLKLAASVPATFRRPVVGGSRKPIIFKSVDLPLPDGPTKETKEAIFYSLFTSFSGFGILVLSSIGAIHSIGVVITVGVLSILFLVFFMM
jgi:hypothetical protein